MRDKYIKLEDAIDAICGSVIVTDKASAEEVANLLSGIKKRLSGLPTIEVSEDCISRSDLLEQINLDAFGNEGQYGDEWKFLETIENAPPVIPSRPRGEWIDHEDYHTCSVCGIDWTFIDDSGGSSFCPNCGAEMRGKEE